MRMSFLGLQLTEKALRWAAYEGQIYNTFLSFIRKFFP